MKKERSFSVGLTPGPYAGKVCIPSSKSVAHRLLICAALGTEKTTLLIDGFSRDILATAKCLRALGAGIETNGRRIRVTPVQKPVSGGLLPCGESGSTLRFLLPVAGALGVSGYFKMEGRLPERPMQVYEDVLRAHGMEISRDGSWLHFGGQLRSGDYRLPGDVSSQYFSGLLMALPRLSGDSTVTAEGKLESAGYIRLTVDALMLSGVRVERNGQTWRIPGSQRFTLPGVLRAEGDWSNAAFFLCMGALSEQGVAVNGLNLSSSQGDMAVLDILRRFGASVEASEGAVTVHRAELRPVTIDAAPIPDLIPVLSVLACGAVGDTHIVNAGRLRMKESDRLQSTAALIRDLGGSVDELPDGLVIHGTGSLFGGAVDSCSDHRIAMSAAVAAGLCRESVTISGADCVRKSYPAFWEDFWRCAR